MSLKRFKRFTDLKITGIPNTAKLVVLVGPNGSGKTSMFEALNHWYKVKGFNNKGSQDYIEKNDGEKSDQRTWFQNKVEITFLITNNTIKTKSKGSSILERRTGMRPTSLHRT